MTPATAWLTTARLAVEMLLRQLPEPQRTQAEHHARALFTLAGITLGVLPTYARIERDGLERVVRAEDLR